MSKAFTSVADAIRDRIAAEGPIAVADYMAMAAQFYYARAEALGAAGDFITAPEISQTFGELIGAWCVATWKRIDAPRMTRLVECGPGRGTLMADVLRATAPAADFAKAVDLHLVERSRAFRRQQRDALQSALPAWHDDIAGVPRGPMILLANEFLDALPIRQFEKTEAGWAERCVTADGADGFAFASRPCDGAPVPAQLADKAPVGAIFEDSPAVTDFVRAAARRVVQDGGAALFIDYGHTATALGETLQAVRRHRHHPVLQDPGTADLTAHVDFAAVARAGRDEGARVFGPVAQGLWLKRLGIEARAARLAAGKPAAVAQDVRAGVRRLTEAEGMGDLFKVIALGQPSLGWLDGFDQDEMQ